MSKTTDVSVDTKVIKKELANFDNLKETLDSIYHLADLSTSELKPKEFFDGYEVDKKDHNLKAVNGKKIDLKQNSLPSPFRTFSYHIRMTINNIEKYMNDLEKADESFEIEKQEIDSGNGQNATPELDSKTFEILVPFAAQIGNQVINVEPGNYNIVDREYNNGELVSITIKIGDHLIKLVVKAGKVLLPQDILGKTFKCQKPFYGLYNGQKIIVNNGEYNILLYHYDNNGNLVGITIDVDGKKVYLEVINNQVVVGQVLVSSSLVKGLSSSLASTAALGSIRTTNRNGYETYSTQWSTDKVDETRTSNGTYQEEDRKESEGKIEEAKPDEEKHYQESISDDTSGIKKDEESNKTYIVKEPIKVIIGGKVIDITNGEYKIVKEYKNINGDVIAVDIELADGRIITVQVINDKVVLPVVNNDNQYYLATPIEITIGGNKVTLGSGNYPILDTLYDENGLKAVLIDNNGYKVWLYLDASGNITKVGYLQSIHGVYTITNPSYAIYDKYGNQIGMFKEGQYYIYEVKYNSNGEVAALRLTPDGEYEKWLYIDSNNQDGLYSFFEQEVSNKEGTKISLFEKNKGLFGVLGVLFVALGTTIVLKKKHDKKKENELSDDEEDWEESELSSGNYPVYEVKKDDAGLITDARITPNDSDNEYWVEV